MTLEKSYTGQEMEEITVEVDMIICEKKSGLMIKIFLIRYYIIMRTCLDLQIYQTIQMRI